MADHEILQNDIEGVTSLEMGIARDFIYVVYCASYVSDTVQFFFVKSTDYGTTWSAPEFMFNAGDISVFKSIAYGDTIHLFWDGQLSRPGPVNCYYLRSTDGGNTWSQNQNLRNFNGSLSDWPGLAQNEDGVLLAHWMDFRYSNFGLTGDIFVRKSMDFGGTWEDEVQVTAHHRAMFSYAVFQGDSVILAYDDWRYGDWREISLIGSIDSGDSWIGDERVSFFNPLDSYDPSIAVSDSHIFLTYAVQDRNGANDSEGIYFTRYDVFEPDAIGNSWNENLPEEIELSAYPNPFNSATTLTISVIDNAEIEIYDITGRKITSLRAVRGCAAWDASGVPSGLYFARVARETASTIKLVLVK